MTSPVVGRHVFSAMQAVDIDALSAIADEASVRPVLPCLVRMSLITTLDRSPACIAKRQTALCLLSGIEPVNSLVALLSVNFSQLEAEVQQQLQLADKADKTAAVTAWVTADPDAAVSEFERSESLQKLRLVLAPLLRILIRQVRANSCDESGANGTIMAQFTPVDCPLLDSELHLVEVGDIICIALAELPHLLPPTEMCEVLLRVRFGAQLICRVVANMPDCIDAVCSRLVSAASSISSSSRVNAASASCADDEIGTLRRCDALRQLCAMYPIMAPVVSRMCVRQCCMPSLAITLTLSAASSDADDTDDEEKEDDDGDVVAFISSALLGPNQSLRVWLQTFVRNAQKRKHTEAVTALQALRSRLTDLLQHIVLALSGSANDEGSTMRHNRQTHILLVRACTCLRAFCALRGIAGLKLSDGEQRLLLQLLTWQPPPTATGRRLATLSLCTLVACPSLLAAVDSDNMSVLNWLRWLVKQEMTFDKKTRAGSYSNRASSNPSSVSNSGSFGELLLLLAIHFHSNNLSDVMALVNNTLGMKMNTRHANLIRFKQMFTQQVFTEQVVASHAVKVPVTPALNANLTGTLPVHCMEQLLRSRVFIKHRVPIHDWIFRQVCASRVPLHTVLPSLLEHFVRSLLDGSRIGGVASAVSLASNLLSDPVQRWRIPEQRLAAVFQLDSVAHQLKAGVFLPVASSPSLASSGSLEADGVPVCEPATAQILLFYYVLLYNHHRMSATSSTSSSPKPAGYSSQLLECLPVCHLLRLAQCCNDEYQPVYAPLLSLIVQHYPQLCLTSHWLMGDEFGDSFDAGAMISEGDARTSLANSLAHLQLNSRRQVAPSMSSSEITALSVKTSSSDTKQTSNHTQTIATNIETCLSNLPGSIAQCACLFDELLRMSPAQLWRISTPLVTGSRHLLRANVPRHLQWQYARLWCRLSQVYADRLWLLTVNSLRCSVSEDSSETLAPKISADHLMHEPLTVLRCDPAVFRTPPLLHIVLQLLTIQLAASRAQLLRHLQLQQQQQQQQQQEQQSVSAIANDTELEELRSAVVLAQESAAVQILLEACLETSADRKRIGGLHLLQEVRSLVCCQLHQLFIDNTMLAKLVHFQGYPAEMLPVLASGVPSMHICLDFVPELLSQPDYDKQVFGVDLVSNLASQYPVVQCMNVARLAVSVVTTLLGIVPSGERARVFLPILPALGRIAASFRSLAEDVFQFLFQLGQMTRCQLDQMSGLANCVDLGQNASGANSVTDGEQENRMLMKEVHATFTKLCEAVTVNGQIY